jgi:hypothetical protein
MHPIDSKYDTATKNVVAVVVFLTNFWMYIDAKAQSGFHQECHRQAKGGGAEGSSQQLTRRLPLI